MASGKTASLPSADRTTGMRIGLQTAELQARAHAKQHDRQRRLAQDPASQDHRDARMPAALKPIAARIDRISGLAKNASDRAAQRVAALARQADREHRPTTVRFTTGTSTAAARTASCSPDAP
jgi:hypothetical protein